VGGCPGTGEKVPFSYTERHFLVVCELAVSGVVAVGSKTNFLTRIMPRILTRKGYEKMMGGKKGTPNRMLQAIVMETGEAADSKISLELYPDALKITNPEGCKVINAATAYSNFHEAGLYKAFERLMEDRTDEEISMLQSLPSGKIHCADTVSRHSGYGKSQY